MTYRYVPRRIRMVAQLLTLAVTAIVGLSIALTPENVNPRMTAIEEAMEADSWGYILVVFGTVGFFAELYSNLGKHGPLFWLVSGCHIVLCSVLAAFSISAIVSVFVHSPWNFGAPALGILVSYFHYMYVQRRPREPITHVD